MPEYYNLISNAPPEKTSNVNISTLIVSAVDLSALSDADLVTVYGEALWARIDAARENAQPEGAVSS